MPSTKLHAQVPTASGLTALAYYSCCASIVGLGLRRDLVSPEALLPAQEIRRDSLGALRGPQGERVNSGLPSGNPVRGEALEP